jgi:hypothetical protein
VCSRSFSTKCKLQNHIKTHTGEKPFKCSECLLKSFSQKYNLQIHKRKHTEKKPFRCSECSLSFSLISNLHNFHTRTHTGEKPLRCLECSQSFSYKRPFETHERQHTGEKPWRCSECSISFSNLGDYPQAGNLLNVLYVVNHFFNKPLSRYTLNCRIAATVCNITACMSTFLKRFSGGQKKAENVNLVPIWTDKWAVLWRHGGHAAVKRLSTCGGGRSCAHLQHRPPIRGD